MAELIERRPEGLYVPAADVYIDPWRPVEKAIITHAHSDHARPGHRAYLAHPVTAAVLRARLGAHIWVEEKDYARAFRIQGVRFSLHPAGHIPGSAQVRVEHKGEVWVVSGDYKTSADGISSPIDPQRCHVFITESTFGLPVFQWEAAPLLAERLCSWAAHQLQAGCHVVLSVYSLGKAQRITRLLNEAWIVPYVHPAVAEMSQALQQAGVPVGNFSPLSALENRGETGVILVPPAAEEAVLRRLKGPVVTAACSGWVSIRGFKRRRNLNQGFGISDHADWPGLLATIRHTEATSVRVTHGFSGPMAQYLSENGLDARPLETAFNPAEAE
ncbi:MAG: ligase-associated DNA damage response exonuclease [Flavobacteriales bacterium]|nr:ligase-associated DNA damage response exonuclease [Flavobacteriales bacterium]MDW8432512.1 ligase-associated DNA damage response exonuclease [Flavobacteriales bacterium]